MSVFFGSNLASPATGHWQPYHTFRNASFFQDATAAHHDCPGSKPKTRFVRQYAERFGIDMCIIIGAIITMVNEDRIGTICVFPVNGYLNFLSELQFIYHVTQLRPEPLPLLSPVDNM